MTDFDDYLNLFDKGAYREAYTVLRDIMDSEPRWSEVGDLYVMCAELELLVNDDVCKASELLGKANELGCSDMVKYYRIHGYVIWRTGERDKGMQYLEKSIALDPRVINLTTLGRMLSFIDSERAMNVWQRVLEKDPKNCLAHIYVGWEADKSGDLAKALLMAKRAEKLNPSVDNIFEIGRLHHKIKQYQSALNAYQEANRRGYADKAILYASIAACYLSLGQASEALKYACAMGRAMRSGKRLRERRTTGVYGKRGSIAYLG
ncbi:MAG: tetratricopeptide repeat protein [Planctomycetota bacterium]|jgi:tetratricopeptide (TPR) repeat protein